MAALPLLAFVSVNAAAPLSAQDSTTQSPPELRDFRLDPKPAPAPEETEPAPAPAVAEPSPVVVSPPIKASAASKPKAETVRPRKVEDVPKTSPAAAQPDAGAAEATVAPKADVAAPATDRVVKPVPTPEPAPTIPAAMSLSSLPSWTWWVPLGLLILAATIWLLRRRKAARLQAEAPDYSENPVSDEVESGSMNFSTATQNPEDATVTTSQLEAEFTPEHAQLSMANLTIAGRLSIRNVGTGPLRDLKVRTTMISASEGQREVIRKFHADDSRGHVENIGNAKPSEEIALTLEIQQPRAELQAFDWRERQFLAPIVLIHLSGKGPKGTENCQLTCLIGREGSPATERMKPFHIDRGPRRFEQLGCRLVLI